MVIAVIVQFAENPRERLSVDLVLLAAPQSLEKTERVIKPARPDVEQTEIVAEGGLVRTGTDRLLVRLEGLRVRALAAGDVAEPGRGIPDQVPVLDRKSTRLNSSH